jgi:glucuronoxylan 4-O-methyltransferase
MKDLFKRILAKSSLALGVNWPSPAIIRVMRRWNRVQLSQEELAVIIAAVRAKAPCNFLVFGLGNDSMLWSRLNRGGNTVFIEDDATWFQKVIERTGLTAYLVDYGTRRNQWEDLLESPAQLEMTFPAQVEEVRWDVILVDGPAGWKDFMPGRMKSIYQSSRLMRNPGDVFVHDCDRPVEIAYCDRFLKEKNLRAEVQKLRHYQMVRHRP